MLVCTTALIAPNPLLEAANRPLPEAANHFLAVPSRICRHHAGTRDAFHACERRLIANVRACNCLRCAMRSTREQADHSNYESDCESFVLSLRASVALLRCL